MPPKKSNAKKTNAKKGKEKINEAPKEPGEKEQQLQAE